MKLTQEEIFYINKFDSITGVMAKDCLIDNGTVIFLVKPELLGKAIGRKGIKAKLLAKTFRKKVEIYPYYEKIGEFIKSAFPDIAIFSIEVKGNNAQIKLESADKKKIMDQLAKFKRIKKLAQRNYNIEDLRF